MMGLEPTISRLEDERLIQLGHMDRWKQKRSFVFVLMFVFVFVFVLLQDFFLSLLMFL